MNSADFVTVIACFPDGILTNVLFIQGGNKTNNSTAISQAYYSLAGCSTDLKVNCYPQYGMMNTNNWDLVLQLYMEGGINIPSASASPAVSAVISTTLANGISPTASFAISPTTSANSTTGNGTMCDDDDMGLTRKRGVVKKSNDASRIGGVLFAFIPLLSLTLMIFL